MPDLDATDLLVAAALVDVAAAKAPHLQALLAEHPAARSRMRARAEWMIEAADERRPHWWRDLMRPFALNCSGPDYFHPSYYATERSHDRWSDRLTAWQSALDLCREVGAA